MLQLERPFSILTLASERVILNNPDYMINALNSLTNLTAVEIKPYSSTIHRSQVVSDLQFEEFMKSFIDSSVEKNWQFINQDKIEECLDGKYNAFSDNHVYITPNGYFAVLDFDIFGNEKFTELHSFDEYKNWSDKEKDVGVSEICKGCKYFGGCLTEHYKWVEVDPKLNGCNGYYNLLEWYNEEPI